MTGYFPGFSKKKEGSQTFDGLPVRSWSFIYYKVSASQRRGRQVVERWTFPSFIFSMFCPTGPQSRWRNGHVGCRKDPWEDPQKIRHLVARCWTSSFGFPFRFLNNILNRRELSMIKEPWMSSSPAKDNPIRSGHSSNCCDLNNKKIETTTTTHLSTSNQV